MQSDFEEFYEIESGSEYLLQRIKDDEKRGMQCIKWDEEEIKFFGNENTFEHAIMELFLLPCNHAVKQLGAESEPVTEPQCKTFATSTQQTDFLGHLSVAVLYNNE